MFDGAAASDPMPWSAVWVLFACLVGGGGVVAWVGRLSAAGRLRRNWLVGIRIPSTLESDAAWDAAHRAGGNRLVLAGVLPTVAGLVLLTRPANGVGAALVLASVVWMLAWVIAAAFMGHRAARSVD